MKIDYEAIQRSIYIYKIIENYKRFMKISYFPEFNLKLIDDNNLIREGYGVAAEHFYNINSNKHTLNIWKDIYKFPSDYYIFHELTHIYDTTLHSAGNKFLYAANRGYLEYHAAQVDLLKLVNATTIDSTVTFSLKQVIDTMFGKGTVLQYINDPHIAVLKIIKKSSYPNSHEEVGNSLGMIFNYLGRISICKMFATDYLDYEQALTDMMIEKTVLGDTFSKIFNRLNGFLGENEIRIVGDYYLKLIVELCDKFI